MLPKIESNPLNTIVSTKTFIKQIKNIKNKYPIISMDEAINQSKQKKVKDSTQVVITFDDGYYDNFKYAYPILLNMGIKATYFLVTDYINSNKPIWDTELSNALQYSTNNVIIKNPINNLDIIRNKYNNHDFLWLLIDMLKKQSSEVRKKILNNIYKQLDFNSKFNNQNRCMEWKEIIEMQNNGMEFGSHSCSHSSLSNINLDESFYEMKISKEIIEKNLQSECKYFALPFGSYNDFNTKVVNFAKNLGYSKCLLNICGYNNKLKDNFTIKRIIMNENKINI